MVLNESIAGNEDYIGIRNQIDFEINDNYQPGSSSFGTSTRAAAIYTLEDSCSSR